MRKHLTILVLTLTCLSGKAQNGVNTPYSRYGFGILSDRSMGFNKGMAGTAQGFRNERQINMANPASYSEVDSLTALFDIGLTLQNGNYKMGTVQQNVRNSSFDYFAYQFRATKNVGVTLGVLPLSNIKYNFYSQSELLSGTENTSTTYSYSGDGGLREVVLGVGWRPLAPISIGINASYLWGDYSHSMAMTLNDSSAYNMRRVYEAQISTYNLQGGIQYIQPISKKDKIVLGATYTYGHDVNNDARMLTQTTSTVTSSYVTQAIVQTENADTAHNAFQLPHSLAVGITYYHSNKWRIGADAELQRWSRCRYPVERGTGEHKTYTSRTGALNDKRRVSLGIDWTPSPESRNNLKRTTYKLGGYFAQSYAKSDFSNRIADRPYEFGVTGGFSLPMRNRNVTFSNYFSKINVAMQWVHTNIPYISTSSLRQETLTENYLRLSIGLTINEHWFYKAKLQ